MTSIRPLAAALAACSLLSLAGCASMAPDISDHPERFQVHDAEYNERHSRAWNIAKLFLYGTKDFESEDVLLASVFEIGVADGVINGSANQLVNGGKLGVNLLLGAALGAATTPLLAREELDAWWSLIPAHEAVDLPLARLAALEKASAKTVAGFEKAGWKVLPLERRDINAEVVGELPRTYNRFRIVKESEKCPAPTAGETAGTGCFVKVETGRSTLDSVSTLPEWFGGAKEVRIIRTIYVAYQGLRTDGTPFLTPSTADRKLVAAEAKDGQLFYGSWRTRELAFVAEEGRIIPFLYPEGKAPTTGEKIKRTLLNGLPFVNEEAEPV